MTNQSDFPVQCRTEIRRRLGAPVRPEWTPLAGVATPYFSCGHGTRLAHHPTVLRFGLLLIALSLALIVPHQVCGCQVTTVYIYGRDGSRSTRPDGRTSTFRYGPASNQLLAATNASGLETRFLRDGGDVVEDLDSTNALVASYVDNPLTLDEHIARVSPGGVHTYLTDPVGSVRAIVDGTGSVRSTYSYRAFGEVRALSEGVPNPDLQRHYARARWYDQGLGRFSGRDVQAPGQPSYLYAGGSPYMFSDPSGEDHQTTPQLHGRQRKFETLDRLAGMAPRRREEPGAGRSPERRREGAYVP